MEEAGKGKENRAKLISRKGLWGRNGRARGEGG